MSRQQRRFDGKARGVQSRRDVPESLGSVAEAVNQKYRGVAGSAELDRLRSGDQAGDRASWLRWIT